MESNRSRRRRRQEEGEIDKPHTASSIMDVDGSEEQSNCAPASNDNSLGTAGGYDGGRSNNDARRKGDDEYDTIVIDQPAPQKKQQKRKESKLKKRRVVDMKRKDDENDNKKQKQPAASNTDTRKQHSLEQNDWTDVLDGNQKRRSNWGESREGSIADPKRRQKSSNNDDRITDMPIPGVEMREGNTRQNGRSSHITDFYNQEQKQTHQPEELLRRTNSILQQTFKHNSLRPLQETAVKGALQGKNQIVIMATGGGKSLCYQLPALAGGNNKPNVRAEKSSVTIVVSPLIALMIDQVNNLHAKGVRTAACLSSTHSSKAKAEIFNRLQTDNKKSNKGKGETNLTPIQLLYCTPELIETEKFRGILTKLYESNRLYMFAIDEAHCLSTWGEWLLLVFCLLVDIIFIQLTYHVLLLFHEGHDFRPAFRKLTWLREAFPDVAIMGCTGTATAKVIEDIREILHFDKNVPTIMGTFNRPNISYEVRFKDSLNAANPAQGVIDGAVQDLIEVVKNQHETAKKSFQPCSGIIYVHKRDDCQVLATQIYKVRLKRCEV